MTNAFSCVIIKTERGKENPTKNQKEIKMFNVFLNKLLHNPNNVEGKGQKKAKKFKKPVQLPPETIS